MVTTAELSKQKGDDAIDILDASRIIDETHIQLTQRLVEWYFLPSPVLSSLLFIWIYSLLGQPLRGFPANLQRQRRGVAWVTIHSLRNIHLLDMGACTCDFVAP